MITLLPIVLSPDTAYAFKDNIRYPGSEAQAKAAAVRADARVEDVLPNGIHVEVPETAIKPAT